MICLIPVDYENLKKMTQTSLCTIQGKQYSLTLRKSTVSDNCYITIEIDGEVLCENKTCTCNEVITNGIVEKEKYPEWLYFSYIDSKIEKNFNYDDLGKTLFLFYWDRDESDLDGVI